MAFPDDLLVKCWFLAGPTACGKTAASLELADRIQAEIIALDSMTLYRSMDIGTAKPSAAERQSVRHHLIDVLNPEEEFSLADYLSLAEVACREAISRGRTPLFVGGAGLYLKGLLRGVFEGPPADWGIRHRLEEQARSDGEESLHQQLQRVDPTTALRLHPNDQRRLVRALEVFELTGQPLSSWQQQGPRPIDQRPQHVYWLSPPRDWLYRRIDARVEQMLADGLIDEVRQLMNRPQPLSHTARQALGYKEVIDWLEVDASRGAGQVRPGSADSAQLCSVRELIQTRTRQFAKRQHTWFRNLEECHAIPITGTETPAEIADLIVRASQPHSEVGSD